MFKSIIIATRDRGLIDFHHTSREVQASFLTDSCAPETDLSEVLLDLDLREDMLVAVSSVPFWDLHSHCSGYISQRKTIIILVI